MSDFVAGIMAAWLRQSWVYLLCGPRMGAGLTFGYFLIAFLIGGPDDS